MLNLNNVPAQENTPLELMPDGTVARGIVKLSGGDIDLPEFGAGQFFKRSQSTNAKWLPIEVTIVGGQFDKRKVWHNIFVDGDKLSERGVPMAKEIGLRTLKSMIDSAFNLSAKPTGHPKIFQHQPVRSSTLCYQSFNLPMGRSLGFASTATDYTPYSDLLSLRLRT